MADIAQLSVEVRSDQLVTGKRRIEGMTQAAVKGEARAKSFGSAWAVAGVAVGLLALRKATKDALDFNKAMAEVNTLLDATANVDGLSDAVRRLSVEFNQDTEEQARALYQVISAGAASSAEAIQILTVANQLAVGGVTSVAVAADGLTSILNAYGLSAQDATDVSDAMFVAMKAGKTTIGQLSASLGKVAPLASQAGVSIDELLAATSALTKGGIQTTEAVTGLRAIMAAVVKPTSEAVKEAELLGIQFDAAALKTQGLAGFMDTLNIATGGNTESLAQLFGGVEALVPALALAGQAGDDMTATMEAMAVKTGATAEAFKVIADSDAFKFEQAMKEVNNALLSVGTAVLVGIVPMIPPIRAFFQGIALLGIDAAVAVARVRLELAKTAELRSKAAPFVGLGPFKTLLRTVGILNKKELPDFAAAIKDAEESLKFTKIAAEELAFEFVLDGTSAEDYAAAVQKLIDAQAKVADAAREAREEEEALARERREADKRATETARRIADNVEQVRRDRQRLADERKRQEEDRIRAAEKEAQAQEDAARQFENAWVRALGSISGELGQMAGLLVDLLRQLKASGDEAEKLSNKTKVGIGLAGLGIGLGSGSVVGGVLGGAGTGFAIGGPAGAVIGAVGGLVGGLLGSSKKAEEAARRMKEAQASFNASLDSMVSATRAAAGDVEAGLRSQIKDLLANFTELFPDSGAFAFFNQNRGLSEFQEFAENIAFRLREDAAAGQAWAKIMEIITGRIDLLNQAQAELAQAIQDDLIAAIKKAADAARDFLGDLGVRGLGAVGQGPAAQRAALLEAQRRELRDADVSPAERAVLEAVQAQELIFFDQQRELEKLTREVQEASAAEIAELQEQTRTEQEALRVAQQSLQAQEQAVAQTKRVIETLTAFAGSLAIDASLSPFDRLTAARSQFEAQLRLARGGDRDAALGLPGSSRSFLDASRGFNASGSGFQSDFARVQSEVLSIRDQFQGQLSVEESMLAELRAQTVAMADQIEILSASQTQAANVGQASIDALVAQFAEANLLAAHNISALLKSLEPITRQIPLPPPIIISTPVDAQEETTDAIERGTEINRRGILEIIDRLENIEDAVNAGTGATLDLGKDDFQ